MELIARLDGEEATLEVVRHGDLYHVSVGERLYEVDVERFGGDGRSLLIEGRQYEVVVKAVGEGRYRVASSRQLDEVEVLDPLTHLARQTRQSAGASGSERTHAYMPGRVVALLAEVGAEVEAGQGILVLEAMKMENEIRAERAGVLRSFAVEPGEAVESGDPLFEIA